MLQSNLPLDRDQKWRDKSRFKSVKWFVVHGSHIDCFVQHGTYGIYQKWCQFHWLLHVQRDLDWPILLQLWCYVTEYCVHNSKQTSRQWWISKWKYLEVCKIFRLFPHFTLPKTLKTLSSIYVVARDLKGAGFLYNPILFTSENWIENLFFSD